MKYAILAFGLFATAGAHANVECAAIYRETVPSKSTEVVETVQLIPTQNTPGVIELKAKLRERTLVLSGEIKTGNFLLSQVWGADYTNGVNTSGTLGPGERLTLSTITDLPRDNGKYVGTAVYKLECLNR